MLRIWIPEFKSFAQDVIPVCWINQDQPKSKLPQPLISYANVHEKFWIKVVNFKERGYILSGYVKIFIRYFSVPKVDQDVRMIYGGTASGSNDLVWVTNFGLTSVKILLCGTLPTLWMVYLDIGEMF